MTDLQKLLYEKFGYRDFRPGQENVIRSVMEGKDTIAILPTGTGKSLCYQLPSYLLNGSTLIISPLVSLMEDQASSMRRNGEKRVAALNSFLSFQDKNRILSQIHLYKFIFVSPEMLLQRKVEDRLKQLDLSLIVVDEAHCISQWGFDFRPDYLRIGEMLGRNRPPVLALTATADRKVIDDIAKYLHMEMPVVERHSLDRPNITYVVEQMASDDKTVWIENRLEQTAGPGIIYVASRKRADELAATLSGKGFSAAAYHAGKEQVDRSLIQEQYIRGEVEWICATNAFGMGIHKDDIRQVIHEHLPNTMASYIQEVGRAGRDGKPACAVLLYAPDDVNITRFIIQNDMPDRISVLNYTESLQAGENPTEAAEMAGMSETAQRVVDFYLSQMPVEEVCARLDELRQNKEIDLQKMLEIVHSQVCIRKKILNAFGERYDDSRMQCCSICGLTEMDWLRKVAPIEPQRKFTYAWEERIDVLLGI
ncbi:RecQ family ATP-dependent DNA helicase [Sporosarcina cyprini]|uniref:RecQ family ATP-dependent DNA helicase n=1 Tax=Sporosarcina cyprini TaxID=2910523 RepID=UPI001EE07D6A|nr:ATP-dependent DNA helicase RecQ [Sporosarcina cyprini]MCG3089968.1 ATP-dependent DNA helicase [Sporosarcina cyprini]